MTMFMYAKMDEQEFRAHLEQEVTTSSEAVAVLGALLEEAERLKTEPGGRLKTALIIDKFYPVMLSRLQELRNMERTYTVERISTPRVHQ